MLKVNGLALLYGHVMESSLDAEMMKVSSSLAGSRSMSQHVSTIFYGYPFGTLPTNLRTAKAENPASSDAKDHTFNSFHNQFSVYSNIIDTACRQLFKMCIAPRSDHLAGSE